MAHATAAGLLGFVLPNTAAAENLVRNGAVEQVSEGSPLHWDLFVQPMDGAYGEVDARAAYDGNRSLKLHVPKPYPEDPYNNWSQNILRNVAGKRAAVRGWIRTESAGNAGIWVQCWQRSPWRLLLVDHTSFETPVSGTQDWTPVELQIDVPGQTSFVTVRCVLQGTGTAWFDGIAFEVAEEEAAAAASEREERPRRPIPPAHPSLPAPPEAAVNAAGQAGTESGNLRGEPVSIESALRELREHNEELAAEIRELRLELEAARRALQASGHTPGASGLRRLPSGNMGNNSAGPVLPVSPVPPLLPASPEDEVRAE